MYRELLVIPFAVLALLVLSFALLGCGDDDEPEPSPTASPSTFEATPADGSGSEPTAPLAGTLALTSSAFEDNAEIPVLFTCNGDNISPPLNADGLPDGTGTLALIMTDVDGPGGDFVHWVVFNTIFPGGDVPEGELRPWGGTVGTNAVGAQTYIGPCPPSGEHRYVFDLYALDSPLTLDASADKAALLAAMEGKMLEQASLTGLYQIPAPTTTP